MTGAFAWLNDLMIWLGRWVPRLMLIPPTHCGVRFGPRGGACELGAGLKVYWPITHFIIEVPVTTQSVQPCSLVLPGKRVGFADKLAVPVVSLCSAAIQFRVVDAVKAATSSLNLHALIDNRASAAIARHFKADLPWTDWIKLAQSDLEHEIAAYGVKLERLDVTQSGSGIGLKNLADWNYADQVDGKSAVRS